MMPIRDHNPSHHFPIMTLAIIAANVCVFIYQLLFPGDLEAFFYTYGLVPCAVTGQCYALPDALPPWMTFFTAMFMHGGWLHIISNMLYLWIFGNNIEDITGSLGFLIFYIVCGLGASAAQIAIDPGSTIVNIGASGAIAGVLGGYLLLFPRAGVDTLVIFGWFVRLVTLPAILVLGGWFVLQLFSGVASLGAMSAEGGVAYFAHLGGFVAGIILIRLFKRRDYTPLYY